MTNAISGMRYRPQRRYSRNIYHCRRQGCRNGVGSNAVCTGHYQAMIRRARIVAPPRPVEFALVNWVKVDAAVVAHWLAVGGHLNWAAVHAVTARLNRHERAAYIAAQSAGGFSDGLIGESLQCTRDHVRVVRDRHKIPAGVARPRFERHSA